MFPFLEGGGEVGALMRSKDWTSTSLGSPERWPQSLRTVVQIVLTSRYAMWIGWGADLAFLYNDAYAHATLGAKHPWAPGQPARVVRAPIWEQIEPRIARVLRTGEATWDEGLLLFLERSGYREETYHTFSYSPLADDHDRIVGMLGVAPEETEGVIGARRLATLNSLAAALSKAHSERDIGAAIRTGLSSNLHDLPVTITYLREDGADEA